MHHEVGTCSLSDVSQVIVGGDRDIKYRSAVSGCEIHADVTGYCFGILSADLA